MSISLTLICRVMFLLLSVLGMIWFASSITCHVIGFLVVLFIVLSGIAVMFAIVLETRGFVGCDYFGFVWWFLRWFCGVFVAERSRKAERSIGVRGEASA